MVTVIHAFLIEYYFMGRICVFKMLMQWFSNHDQHLFVATITHACAHTCAYACTHSSTVTLSLATSPLAVLAFQCRCSTWEAIAQNAHRICAVHVLQLISVLQHSSLSSYRSLIFPLSLQQWTLMWMVITQGI